MPTATLARPTFSRASPDQGPPNQAEGSRMYAIAFDMDTDTLQKAYPGPSWNNAYAEIQKVLSRHGFTRQQGSVNFGDTTVNAVSCVLASMDLSRSLAWFAISVRDIRMLRIEELNDLLPAVRQGAAGDPA
jgi:virulence-associated protein VapD